MLTVQACTYAQYLCKKEGVKFVLGDPQGKLDNLVRTGYGTQKKVVGIKTCDGLIHRADVVVVACESQVQLPEYHSLLMSPIRWSLDCCCYS